ncbi:MAG: ATP-binding protein, partial [Acidimicrobiales bacterium]
MAINSDDEVLFVNEAAIALLGGEPDSGTDVLARFSLKDPRSGELLTIEQLWRDLTDGEDITGTVGYLCSRHGHTATANTSAAKINAADINAGRDRRPVRASITPLVEGTKITGMVLLFDDSTERNETMESLARALREAQRAAEAKSQFLANMSHEIRTPMNGVLGMLELVAHTELDHQQRHWISVARTSGDALLDIINEILDFSRLEAGRTELEKVDFDPARVADDVMSLLGPRAQANGLAVSVVHGVDLPRRVVGDPGRIRQVLVNFVGNAIKFTRHGSVRLLVDRIDPPTSRRPHGDGTTLTQTTPTQTTLRFVVEDTGVGIPSDRLDDLFAPFNQLDVSTTRTFGGTGLGLSICRETVKLMEGNIAVASQIGVGSSFAFTVPVGLAPGKNDEPGLADDDATMASGGEVPHLLVAEDNTINQILIKAILDHMGVTYEM